MEEMPTANLRYERLSALGKMAYDWKRRRVGDKLATWEAAAEAEHAKVAPVPSDAKAIPKRGKDARDQIVTLWAVVRIQASWRRWLARQHAAELRRWGTHLRAIRTVQACWRGRVARRRAMRARKAKLEADVRAPPRALPRHPRRSDTQEG